MTTGHKPSRAEARRRLDVALVERGLAESRSVAQRMVLAGEVRVDGEIALKPSQLVVESARLVVLTGPRFVSRGGDKLAAALTAFGLDVEGWVCADVGASTGGFTDCLLQGGARRVYAVDVGRGILHWKLRRDDRVSVLEGTNARYLRSLPEPVHLVTLDASFISLALLLPSAAGWLDDGGHMVALVKPQFEAGRRQVGKGGVIRNAQVHRQVIERVAEVAAAIGLGGQDVIRSPLRGPKGNVEFFLWAVKGERQRDGLEARIEAVVEGP